jgi:hypothetical protein
MILLETCAGHAFTIPNTLAIWFVEKVNENALAHELHRSLPRRRAIGCTTLWRQGALQRPDGRRVFRGLQTTTKHLRVPRASALICVEILLL